MTFAVERKSSAARNTNQVQVINRAIGILRAIRDSGSLSLSQLARKVGLARTTVYRIVSTLESEGLLTIVEPGGQIQLGMELVSFGAAVRSDLRSVLRPYLEELSLSVDETVDLAVLEKDHVLFLDQVTRIQRLRAVSGVGLAFPLHCTANGKALLSKLPVAEVMKLLPEKLQVYTPNTIQTLPQLMQELEEISLTGIAYDREEHTPGICAVGAAIQGVTSNLVAISIPVPSVRFYGNEGGLVSALLRTSEAVSRRF